MKDDLNLRIIESAVRMIDFNDKQIDLMQKLDSQSTSRLVWFVAIAGFSLINVPVAASYANASSRIPLMLVVWLGTAFLATFAHWQFRNRSVANIHIYVARRELLMAFIANGAGAATMAALNEIVANAKEPLPKLLKAQVSSVRFADILELLTMISFVCSMGLTVFTLVNAIWQI